MRSEVGGLGSGAGRMELGRGEDWAVLEMSQTGVGRAREACGWRAKAG